MAIPGDDATVSAAADQGKPLVVNASKQPVSQALLKLAQHTIQELHGEKSGGDGKVAEPIKVGFFARLFGRRAKAGG